MEILRQGSEGSSVRRWQQFLVGLGHLAGNVDGIFGPRTAAATQAFQRTSKLSRDGVVGPDTYATALRAGFDPGFLDPLGGTAGSDWPPRPDFAPLISNLEREAVFGKFRFERIGGDGRIKILDGWAERNVKPIVVPQLRGVEGAPASGRIFVHHLVAAQVRALFQAWEDEGLVKLVLSWAGSFAPRFVRGSNTTLSNHAWGTGFDINAAWNGLGKVPALSGRQGSVRELVPAANLHGFFWGGHFKGRSDGMHFEAARVLG